MVSSYEFEFEFEALKWVSGPLYVRKRDEWLASVADARTRLKRYEQDRDWRTSITAQILLGWLDHRKEYESLFREIDEIDWVRVGKGIKGNHAVWDEYSARAQREPDFAKNMFPLCLEVMLKTQHEVGVVKDRIFFEMLAQMKDERAIEPIFWYLQNIAEDQRDRELGAFALQLYPDELLRTRIARLRTDQRAVFEALERRLDRSRLPPE